MKLWYCRFRYDNVRLNSLAYPWGPWHIIEMKKVELHNLPKSQWVSSILTNFSPLLIKPLFSWPLTRGPSNVLVRSTDFAPIFCTQRLFFFFILYQFWFLTKLSLGLEVIIFHLQWNDDTHKGTFDTHWDENQVWKFKLVEEWCSKLKFQLIVLLNYNHRRLICRTVV